MPLVNLQKHVLSVVKVKDPFPDIIMCWILLFLEGTGIMFVSIAVSMSQIYGALIVDGLCLQPAWRLVLSVQIVVIVFHKEENDLEQVKRKAL
jgi:hypothetical protein